MLLSSHPMAKSCKDGLINKGCLPLALMLLGLSEVICSLMCFFRCRRKKHLYNFLGRAHLSYERALMTHVTKKIN